MKVIIFGSRGLLGHALLEAFHGEILAAYDREQVDVADKTAVARIIAASRTEVVINAAAYNAVDAAEIDAAAARQAMRVNAEAVSGLAQACAASKATFVHISTDYVFDGEKGAPYVEDDEPNPLSVYGRSKAQGERFICELGASGLKYYLIRTSRLFGPQSASEGSKPTFIEVVLEAAASGRQMRFIDGEEIASPTYVNDLAVAIRRLIDDRQPYGIYHRTNDGAASWYEFARAILEESGVKGAALKPIRSADLERPARRPRYSVLRSTKLPALRPWRDALRAYLKTTYHSSEV